MNEVSILAGEFDGSTTAAVLVDRVSGLCFGPMFDDAEEAEAFLVWYGETEGYTGEPDVRLCPMFLLVGAVKDFREARGEQCNHDVARHQCESGDPGCMHCDKCGEVVDGPYLVEGGQA